MTRTQRFVLIGSLTLATLIKAFLAWETPDTLDTIAYAEFLNEIRDGGAAVYDFRGSFNNLFIFPPAMIHLLKALGWVADSTGLPFRFWLRLLPSVADVGSFFLIWQLLRDRQDLFRILFLLALCPASIVINGYKGNVDAFMIFFVLLAVWAIEVRKSTVLAGAALGMALNVKAVPLMFAPAWFFYLKSAKPRMQYLLGAVAVIAIGSMPFLWQRPDIGRHVFAYSSIYGVWGLTKLAVLVAGTPAFLNWPYDPTGGHLVFATIMKWLVIVAIVAVSYLMNRRGASLLKQLGLVVALFLFLTPGFGVQYLVWLVPFVTAAGLRATAIYYSATTLYVAFASEVFACDAFGCLTLMFLCWLTTGVVAIEFLKKKAVKGDRFIVTYAGLHIKLSYRRTRSEYE